MKLRKRQEKASQMLGGRSAYNLLEYATGASLGKYKGTIHSTGATKGCRSFAVGNLTRQVSGPRRGVTI